MSEFTLIPGGVPENNPTTNKELDPTGPMAMFALQASTAGSYNILVDNIIVDTVAVTTPNIKVQWDLPESFDINSGEQIVSIAPAKGTTGHCPPVSF